jgi:hypothetical protein
VAARGLCRDSRSATASDLVNMIKTTGGHGGPPLQLNQDDQILGSSLFN